MERFAIFQRILREVIKPNMKVASVPCGLCDDLITLSSKSENVEIYGIDFDYNSLEQAIWNHQNCNNNHTYNTFTLKTALRNAFELVDFEKCFDVITSNGLNIYVQDDDEVIELYKSFHKCLKPNGLFLTSHIIPPTDEVFHDEYYSKARIIFNDIIQVKWNNPRNVEMIVHQLDSAGFDIVSIEFDNKQFYPSFLCKKRDH